MNHDHTGAWGAITGISAYIGGLYLNIIPDAPHFGQSIFTAVSCAGAGWVTSEILKYLKPRIANWLSRIKRKFSKIKK